MTTQTLLKPLWMNMPDRLVEHFPRRKMIFMFIYAVVAFVDNFSFVDKHQIVSDLFGSAFLGLSIAACFVLIREFQRRLRSGQRWLHVRREERKTFRLRLYSVVYWLTLYVAITAFFVALGGAVSDVWLSFDPGFAHSVDLNSIQSGPVGGFFISLLACTEEIWRWSMICSLLLVVRACSKRRWASGRFRAWTFVIAILLSSVGFGSGHVGEYPQYGWTTLWALSTSGVVLALSAIVTRRFIAAMLVHFVYDFLTFTQNPGVYMYSGAVVLCVVILPAFWWLFRALRRNGDLAI